MSLKLFNIKQAVNNFNLMDKGMVSIANMEKIQAEGFDYCVSLRKNSIAKLKGIPWNYLTSINENNVESKRIILPAIPRGHTTKNYRLKKAKGIFFALIPRNSSQKGFAAWIK